MPRRQPRLPVTTVAQIPSFRLSLDAWARLEKDYRRPIPMGVRDRLEGVIIDYLRLDEMEQKAPPQTSGGMKSQPRERLSMPYCKDYNLFKAPRPMSTHLFGILLLSGSSWKRDGP